MLGQQSILVSVCPEKYPKYELYVVDVWQFFNTLNKFYMYILA